MQLTLFDAICPTCLTPWTIDVPGWNSPLRPVHLTPCSLACL